MPSPVLHHRDDVLRMLDELHEARQDILKACDKLSPAQLADPVIPGTPAPPGKIVGDTDLPAMCRPRGNG